MLWKTGLCCATLTLYLARVPVTSCSNQIDVGDASLEILVGKDILNDMNTFSLALEQLFVITLRPSSFVWSHDGTSITRGSVSFWYSEHFRVPTITFLVDSMKFILFQAVHFFYKQKIIHDTAFIKTNHEQPAIKELFVNFKPNISPRSYQNTTDAPFSRAHSVKQDMTLEGNNLAANSLSSRNFDSTPPTSIYKHSTWELYIRLLSRTQIVLRDYIYILVATVFEFGRGDPDATVEEQTIAVTGNRCRLKIRKRAGNPSRREMVDIISEYFQQVEQTEFRILREARISFKRNEEAERPSGDIEIYYERQPPYAPYTCERQ